MPIVVLLDNRIAIRRIRNPTDCSITNIAMYWHHVSGDSTATGSLLADLGEAAALLSGWSGQLGDLLLTCLFRLLSLIELTHTESDVVWYDVVRMFDAWHTFISLYLQLIM